ncbi:LytR cell envelope-related transcriptional attenuator [Lachnospiraceae bacterium]|nr:LytR cell envelope-related transcriptional attenuator [Lachnospiraceae bacterium]
MAKKNKKNPAGIFFLFFLKAIVIILGLVILAMGAYLIKYTMSADNKKSEQEFDDSMLVDNDRDDLLASDTDSALSDDKLLFDNEEGAVTEASKDIASDDKIVVLNATETAGLAAAWKERLAEKGFTKVETGNYLGESLEKSKIVVTEEGTGNNLSEIISGASVENGSADSVDCDADKDGVKAFIIIGNSDDIVSE